MNKIVILRNNGGRLANQLWSYAAIYSYCLEMNYICHNPSFFRYYKYFDIDFGAGVIGLVIKLTRYLPIKFLKLFYNFYANLTAFFNRQAIVSDDGDGFVLPPGKNKNLAQQKLLDKISHSSGKTFYFCGWLFNNDVGLIKYRKEMVEFFTPQQKYLNEIKSFISNLRTNYGRVIGVHIRQGDYKKWNEGKFYFTNFEAGEILRDFTRVRKIDLSNTVFMICSDSTIDKSAFEGLKVVLGPGGELTDLYALSLTDLIIGSNSTYGSWASYCGGIPFFHFSRSKIDWNKPVKIWE